jgi:hypothetical protein
MNKTRPLRRVCLFKSFWIFSTAAWRKPAQFRIKISGDPFGGHDGLSKLSAGGKPVKKKDAKKKLLLSTETLVRLTNPDLGKVAGGAWSDESVCPTTAPSDCRPCA